MQTTAPRLLAATLLLLLPLAACANDPIVSRHDETPNRKPLFRGQTPLQIFDDFKIARIEALAYPTADQSNQDIENEVMSLVKSTQVFGSFGGENIDPNSLPDWPVWLAVIIGQDGRSLLIERGSRAYRIKGYGEFPLPVQGKVPRLTGNTRLTLHYLKDVFTVPQWRERRVVDILGRYRLARVEVISASAAFQSSEILGEIEHLVRSEAKFSPIQDDSLDIGEQDFWFAVVITVQGPSFFVRKDENAYEVVQGKHYGIVQTEGKSGGPPHSLTNGSGDSR